MKNLVITLFAGLSLFMTSCIGDDIIQDEIDETLRINNPIDTIGPGQSHQFDLRFTNNIGDVVEPNALWESSDPTNIEVNSTGLITAVGDGSSTITVSVELPDGMALSESLDIAVSLQDEKLTFTNLIDTLGLNETFQLEFIYTNNLGQPLTATPTWNSSNPSILSVDGNGNLTGLAMGSATISATVALPDGSPLTTTADITVAEETSSSGDGRSGTIVTTSFYVLSGEFEIVEIDNGIRIDIAEDWVASESLPGLYVYLGNNPNTISNALEIQAVQVFEGAHSYEVMGVDIDEYDYLLYWCKPFNVKVGDGKIE